MLLNAVHAKAALKKIGDAGIAQLPGLYLNQIVRKREQPKARRAELV